jgi:hypothetical protein
MIWDRGGRIVGHVRFVLGEEVGGRRLGTHESNPKVRRG